MSRSPSLETSPAQSDLPVIVNRIADVVQGAMIYQMNQCGNCHTANGEGMKVGPGFNGLSRRRSREWIENQIRNPESHFPESMMPAYDLPARETELLVTYL